MNNFFKKPITASITAIIVLISPFVTITTILAENTDTLPSSYPETVNSDIASVVESETQEESPEVVSENQMPIEAEVETNLLPKPEINEIIKTWSYSPELNIAVTNSNVKENFKYSFPGNELVSVTFTSLPDVLNRSGLTIKEITLTSAQIEETGAVSPIAYEITTGMQNGTFTYDLTLPTSESNVEVKYASNTSTLDNAAEVTQETKLEDDFITITGLDHFTVFVVTSPNIAGDGSESNDDCVTASIGGSVTCYDTIQEAINAAVDGDDINIKDGTYTECLTLTTPNITITGESEAGTIIDASSCGGYGFHITTGSDGALVSTLTLLGPDTGSNSNYGFKVSDLSNFSLSNVTVTDSRKTGVDLNGVNGATIDNVTVTGTTSGNGFATTDSNDIAYSNITTSGNAWGGIAIYTYGRYYTLGSDNISLTGVNSIGEADGIYEEEGNYNDPSNPEPITNVSLTGYDYIVRNETYRGAGSENFSHYQSDYSTAEAFALALAAPAESYIVEIATNFVTIPGEDIAEFEGTPRFIATGDDTNPAAVLRTNNFFTDVRFAVNGGSTIAGTNQGAIDATYNSWELFEGMPSGYNDITAEVFVDGEWYPVSDAAIAYTELNAPTLLTPADGTIFSASDLPATQSWTSIVGASEYDYQSCTSDPSLNSNECPAADIVYSTITSSTSRTIGTSAATGEYWWQVRAVDSIGNESEWSAPLSFEVDKIKPTLVVDSPVDNFLTSSNFDITVTATDGESGLANIVINIKNTDGSNLASCYNSDQGGVSNTTVSCTVNISGLADGVYSFRTNTLDRAGSMSSTVTQYFEIDNEAPDVEITAPEDGDILTGSVDIYGTVTDENPLRYYTVVRDSSNSVVAGPGTVYESNSITDEFLFTWDTTLVPDGEYTIWLAARDNANNRDGGSEDEITVSVNNVAPSKPIMSTIYKGHNAATWTDLGCSAFTNSTEITIAWEENPESDIAYYWLGTKFNPRHRQVTHPTTIYKANMSPGSNPYFYTIIAVDVAGNESEISDPCGDLILDQTKPVLSVDSPNDSVVVNSAFEVTVSATDSGDSGLNRVVINVKDTDGSTNLFTCLNEDQAGANSVTTSCILDISTLSDGETYYYRTNANDRAGNVSNTIQQSFTVDLSAPDVEITEPEDGDAVNGEVDVFGSIEDDNPWRYYLIIRNSSNAVVAGPGTVYESGSLTDEFLYTWDTTLLPDGEYTIRLEARDLAGNKDAGSVDQITVTVDNTKPILSELLNQSFDEGSTLPSILAEASDTRLDEFCVEITSSPFGAVSEVCVEDDGDGEWDLSQILEDITGSKIIDTSIYPEGDYEISYYATDAVGNQSDSQTVTYTIVNVTPIVNFGTSQTIDEGDAASFTGSFEDPSTEDAGDGEFDDSDWTATIDYGEGAGEESLGTFSDEGSIAIPDNTYENYGTYTATLKVCESDVNVDSEGECSSQEVTVTVNSVEEPDTSTPSNPTTSNPGTTNSNNGGGNVLGVGSGEFESDTTDEDEDTEEDEEGEVLGAEDDPLTCEEKDVVSGRVYIDKNDDGDFNEDDEASSGVKVSIFYFENNSRKLLSTITTDDEGMWDFEVCPGEYEVVIDEDTIPSNTEIEDESVDLDIEGEVNGINFALSEKEKISISTILPVGVGIFFIILVLTIYLLSKKAKESELKNVG